MFPLRWSNFISGGEILVGSACLGEEEEEEEEEEGDDVLVRFASRGSSDGCCIRDLLGNSDEVMLLKLDPRDR